MEVLLASGNKHKLEEFKKLLPAELFDLKVADRSLDILEDGNSYFTNSFIKAEGYYKEFKRPVLADDSGLTVLALPDELGVFSARFGGTGLTSKERVELLLKKMSKVASKDRGAYFTCVLCLYLSPREIFFFEGRVYGEIAYSSSGEFGFGYDPVFLPKERNDGKTLAEVPGWKDEFSHRARAIVQMKKFMNERIAKT